MLWSNVPAFFCLASIRRHNSAALVIGLRWKFVDEGECQQKWPTSQMTFRAAIIEAERHCLVERTCRVVQEIKPFESVESLAKQIDNGGRIYNIFTKADDNVVTGAELAKAAGVIGTEGLGFLYLEMAVAGFEEDDRKQIIEMLEPGLRRRFEGHGPRPLAPSEMDERGKPGKAAIMTGYVRFLEDRSQFSSFIMIPMMVNNVTTFTMIPIFDQFNVYEIFETSDFEKPCGIVTSPKTMTFKNGSRIRVAGYLRELKEESGKPKQHAVYLETYYYAALQKT